MIGANHVLFGTITGLMIKNPVAVFPIAFASHFVMDAIPHFGLKESSNVLQRFKSRIFKSIVTVDAILVLITLLYLALSVLWISLLASLVALSPDLVWIYRFIVQERWGTLEARPKNFLSKFHAQIQWFERPIGLVVEIIMLTILLVILLESV